MRRSAHYPHAISKALSDIQLRYVEGLLTHRCFRDGYVTLGVSRLRDDRVRVTFRTQWEYKKTLYINQFTEPNPRIDVQMQIYDEYVTVFEQAMAEAREVDGSDAYDETIDWQFRIDRLRGPVELRAIIAPYAREIEDLYRESTSRYGSSKLRTRDRKLIIGLDQESSIMGWVSYMRYEEDAFAIVYTDNKTRIETNRRLPEAAVDGFENMVTGNILGDGFARNAQRVLGIENKKSRAIISVETITCLCAPNTGI